MTLKIPSKVILDSDTGFQGCLQVISDDQNLMPTFRLGCKALQKSVRRCIPLIKE